MSHSFGANEIVVLPLGKRFEKTINLAVRRGRGFSNCAAMPLYVCLKNDRRQNPNSGEIGQNRLHAGA
jgi:hypothetical protein